MSACPGSVEDVEIIGSRRQVRPGRLVRRELSSPVWSRRVALYNVGFTTPGEQRWTCCAVARFLAKGEQARLDPTQRASVRREAAVVHLAARRSDVIVARSMAMADPIATIRSHLSSRVVVRPHPVSAACDSRLPGEPILCPVVFAPQKQIPQRLSELLAALNDLDDPSVWVQVTARAAEVPAAGPTLCGYTLGDSDSLRRAVEVALTADVTPDPGPFDPDRYFGWLLGQPR